MPAGIPITYEPNPHPVTATYNRDLRFGVPSSGTWTTQPYQNLFSHTPGLGYLGPGVGPAYLPIGGVSLVNPGQIVNVNGPGATSRWSGASIRAWLLGISQALTTVHQV